MIGNTASDRQENTTIIEGTGDQENTGGSPESSLTVNENTVNVRTLERCYNERVDKEMSNFADMVEERNQNAILAAFDGIVAPKLESAIKSKNASSGLDATNVKANSERGEHSLIIAP